MDSQEHWQRVFQTRSPQQTSWHQPHLHTSLDWITSAAPNRSASIIDIGSGESTLPDDLLALGYRNITVLDIAAAALSKSQTRLGPASTQIQWLVGDITQIALPDRGYDLWHDRAFFHFLIDPAHRRAYARQLTVTLKPGGHAIIAAFGPNGPEKCSGLPTARYDAHTLEHELGAEFRLTKSSLVDHCTPSGAKQQFLYCDFILS